MLELLGTHVGVAAFTERVEVNAGRDMAKEIREAQQKLRANREKIAIKRGAPARLAAPVE